MKTRGKISYRQKNKYLLIIWALSLLLFYYFVFSDSLTAYQVNQETKKRFAESVSASTKEADMEKKLEKFNSVLSPYVMDSLKDREFILTSFNNFSNAHGILLKEFPAPIVHAEKDYDIETNILVAEGSFIDLLKLVYEFERKNKIARPVSVNFLRVYDYKTRRESTVLKLYLQNIRLKSSQAVSSVLAENQNNPSEDLK